MDVAKVLSEHNIVPKKEFDQHFLKDDKILNEEIKAAQLKPADTVLEIGAGIGNLTRKIAEKSRVIAIEKDYNFRNILKGMPNTNILFGDALEILESLRQINERKIAKGEQPKAEFNKIVANIPYGISQDLVIELMRHPWNTTVLIVQKEFAEKLKGKDKLGILMSEATDVKILRRVPAEAFYPKAVPSSLISIKQKRRIDYNYWLFLVEIFRDRNRDVKNVVKNYPVALAKKKVNKLTVGEIKKLYELNI